MIKMMILAPRRSGLSHAEFRRYVTEVHGPLVKSIEEVAAGIHHYHYNFPLTDAPDEVFHHPAANHLDIITEAWFTSRAAQLRNMEEPRYLEIIRPDEGRFADEARARLHYTHEIAITEGSQISYKAFYLRHRRAGMNRAEFQSRWRSAFTEIVAESSVWSKVVVGCIQNHVLPEELHPFGDESGYYDLIDELFLRDPSDLARLGADRTLIDRLSVLERELLDPGKTLSRITETVRNIP